ncbi:MAG TPA: ribosome silencing factor [Sutterella sp.]|nr:ribosome silencing factor [Sutterella sp.]
MDIRTLQNTISKALLDTKAKDIRVYDTTKLSSEFDRVIIATATSNRHTRALGHAVAEDVKKAGGSVLSIEGLDAGEWVLVDCEKAIVHIMQPQMREYYALEELWGEKSVHLKLLKEAAKAENEIKDVFP